MLREWRGTRECSRGLPGTTCTIMDYLSFNESNGLSSRSAPGPCLVPWRPYPLFSGGPCIARQLPAGACVIFLCLESQVKPSLAMQPDREYAFHADFLFVWSGFIANRPCCQSHCTQSADASGQFCPLGNDFFFFFFFKLCSTQSPCQLSIATPQLHRLLHTSYTSSHHTLPASASQHHTYFYRSTPRPARRSGCGPARPRDCSP